MPSSDDRCRIDLNVDLGEGRDDAPLYALVTSANIACGGHAGTIATMAAAIERCRTHDVAIGAHPGYPDPLGFGRRSPVPAMPPTALEAAVDLQVACLARCARERGARLTHVKPHGALYHDAATDRAVAEAVAKGVARTSRDVVLVGLAGSAALKVWTTLGFRVAAEGFADRAYRADGTLVPRGEPGALILDPTAAAAQAVRLARSGTTQTICAHGDTEGAALILAAVGAALRAAGFALGPLALHRPQP